MFDENLLLAQAQALDDEALAIIHDKYYTPIFRYIVMKTGNQAVAEDLTSEVFIRLLNALRDHTAPRNTLRGWLYGVASRVVSDYYRKQYRHPQEALDEKMPAKSTNIDEKIDFKLTWEKVQQAMTELTSIQREVIALRYGQGLPIKEVAQLIGKSEGAIKQLQARAVATLTKLMGVNEKAK